MNISLDDLSTYLTAIIRSNYNSTLQITDTPTHHIIITPRINPATTNASTQTDKVTITREVQTDITSTRIKEQAELLKSYFQSPYYDEELSDDDSETYEGDRLRSIANRKIIKQTTHISGPLGFHNGEKKGKTKEDKESLGLESTGFRRRV